MTPSNPLTVAIGLLATGVFATGSYLVQQPPRHSVSAVSLTSHPHPPRPVQTPTSLALSAVTVTYGASYSRTSAATPSV